jgi:hypothetical protein
VFNYVGVAASLLLALISASLGAAALAQGAAHALPLGPQWAELGGGARGVAEVASIVAVLLACYVGHQNLHPLLPLLKPYTREAPGPAGRGARPRRALRRCPLAPAGTGRDARAARRLRGRARPGLCARSPWGQRPRHEG